jgi:MFS transporter, DHA1 family, multidrug resistance protein
MSLTTSPPRTTALVLLSALSVLPVNMILPTLPNIAATFHAGSAIANLAVGGYAIVTALTEIVAGALSDRYGRRPVALLAVSLFIVASVGCGLASSIGEFLLFRAMQASIAACFSIVLVVVKETTSERKAVSRFGYISMGWAIAPMLGPLLGGTLGQLFGWRAIFAVLTVLGVAVLALTNRELKETAALSSKSTGSRIRDYSSLLSSAAFWAYSICMAFSMGTLYIFLGGAPLTVSASLGVSGAALGFYMGLVPAGFIVGSYLAGRYAHKHEPNTILIVGRVTTCAGLLGGLVLSIFSAHYVAAFFGPCMFIGIGNGLMMPAANMGVLSVRADLAGSATGLAAAISIAGGALIASVAGLFLQESGAVHALFGTMLTSAVVALAAAVGAARLDKRSFKASQPALS